MLTSERGLNMPRYYVVERPIAQGTHPEGATNVCPWLPRRKTGHGFEAYGYVDYNHPLPFPECERYGLVPEEAKERAGHVVLRGAAWRPIAF